MTYFPPLLVLTIRKSLHWLSSSLHIRESIAADREIANELYRSPSVVKALCSSHAQTLLLVKDTVPPVFRASESQSSMRSAAATELLIARSWIGLDNE